MKTLQEAWNWYESTRTNLDRMRRLGTHHWDDESLLNASIWRDDRFKEIEAKDLVRETRLAIGPLDGLGVLVLFSVFEAVVRDHLESIIKPLTGNLGHELLEQAASDVLDGIRQGSFANQVLAPLQKQGRITPELSNKVKQVRDYRNWIAHGKGESDRQRQRVVGLTPKEAYERLKEFLEALGMTVVSEQEEADVEGNDNTLD